MDRLLKDVAREYYRRALVARDLAEGRSARKRGPICLRLKKYGLPKLAGAIPQTVVREDRVRQPQLCDQCGGRFGLVTHRWLRAKFCKKACKDAYLRELALGRDKIRRWYGWPLRKSGS